jgi:hypothetical protein
MLKRAALRAAAFFIFTFIFIFLAMRCTNERTHFYKLLIYHGIIQIVY